jgi:hypothetical protein
VQSKTIVVHDSLRSALNACDTWIEQHGYQTRLLLRAAPWRYKPASEAQIKLLRKLKICPQLPYISKGLASDLINRHVLGAKGRATSAEVKERRQSKLSIQDIGQVAVGPIV